MLSLKYGHIFFTPGAPKGMFSEEEIVRAFVHTGHGSTDAAARAASLVAEFPPQRIQSGMRALGTRRPGVMLLRDAASGNPVRDRDGRPVLLQTGAVLPGDDAETQVCQALHALAEAYAVLGPCPEVLVVFDVRDCPFGIAPSVIRVLLRFPRTLRCHVCGANGLFLAGWSFAQHLVPDADAIRFEAGVDEVRERFGAASDLSRSWGGTGRWHGVDVHDDVGNRTSTGEEAAASVAASWARVVFAVLVIWCGLTWEAGRNGLAVIGVMECVRYAFV